jgi:hypothetical protein
VINAFVNWKLGLWGNVCKIFMVEKRGINLAQEIKNVNVLLN